MTQAIPHGYHTVTPSFTFKSSTKAIEFYQKAFNAEVLDIFRNLDSKGIMHATIQIGNSILMMGDENPGQQCRSAESLGISPISLFLYVENVDAVFKQAIDAGAQATMPVAEMFWGDRAGVLTDPFGYSWMIATHTRDLTKERMQEEAKVFFAEWEKNQAKQKK